MKKKEKYHNYYMTHALKQAKKAYEKGEVPVGAIVVDKKGIIIGRGYNQIEEKKCQTKHAEIQAIQKACKKTGDWRLTNCWLYVTLEPCIMCFGLIQLSRISGVAFGIESPLFGYKKQKIKSKITIKDGIKKQECKQMLQDFFKSIRKK